MSRSYPDALAARCDALYRKTGDHHSIVNDAGRYVVVLTHEVEKHGFIPEHDEVYSTYELIAV